MPRICFVVTAAGCNHAANIRLRGGLRWPRSSSPASVRWPSLGSDDKPKRLRNSWTRSLRRRELKPTPQYVTESLRGRLVWLAEALKRRYGVESDADAAESGSRSSHPMESLCRW